MGFQYPGRALFVDWSVNIPSGVTRVTGGEGSGKSTLLRLLAGDLAAQAGQLAINHTSLTDEPLAYQQQVFWTDPRSKAFDRATVADYFESVRKLYPGFDDAALAQVVPALSLTEHQHKPIHMLSAGSKRKVWFAAAFASRAAVTLLDQPFTALDKPSIQLVLNLLVEAANHRTRAWLVADYAAPEGVPLACTIDLGD